MSDRARRSSTGLFIGEVVLACLVCLLGWSRSAEAAAPSECLAAEAISELEPDERDQLQAMCEHTEGSGDTPPIARDETLAAGLRLEGWKAAFVARALSRVQAPPARQARQREYEAWVTERLTRTHTTRGKGVPSCASFHDVVAGSLRDLEQGDVVLPPNLRDLGSDPECVSSPEQDQLEALTKGWRLLTIPRRTKDAVEVLVVDTDGLVVHQATPIPYAHDGQQAWLVLLPRDHMVTISVDQSDLDMPWVETERFVDIDFTLARRRSECVIIEAGIDEGSAWSVIVNGAPTSLEVVSTHQQQKHTQRAVLTLPRDPRSIEERALSGHRSSREVVFVSADEGTAPWVSSLASTRAQDHGRCRSVAYDLTGLNSPKEQIGVAQVAVDRQCRDRGIVPSRIRSYVEKYTEHTNKTLIPLDAWAEVMEVFRALEGRLGSQVAAERGASRGDLDDSEQMVVLASELRRRGVDSLLYFDVRCPKSTLEVTVIGTRVDLDDFVGRARSKVTGIDTDELLAVRSHDSHSHDLRESMEVVLSDLLKQPHVRFVAPPKEVEHGQPTQLRAIGDGTEVELEVWSLRGTNVSICAEVEELNELSSFDDFANIRFAAASRAGTPTLVRRSTAGQVDVELGGLKKGTYVAIGTAIPSKRNAHRSDQIGHALCFTVEERELELTVDLGGLKQLTQPRTASVSTQYSFVRIAGGVRYTSWSLLEFGGRVGYELVEYSTQVVPAWDDLVLVDLPSNGKVPLTWRRHGLFLAPFLGLRVPFGHLPWERCRGDEDCEVTKARRRANPARLTYFLDAQVSINFGIADIDSLPTEITSGNPGSVLAPDLDLGVKTGFRVRPKRLMRFGVFAGVLVTDVTNARSSNAQQQDFWTNDWGVRGVVGLDVALGLRTGRS